MSWSLVGVPGGLSAPTSNHDIAVGTASAGLTAAVAAIESYGQLDRQVVVPDRKSRRGLDPAKTPAARRSGPGSCCNDVPARSLTPPTKRPLAVEVGEQDRGDAVGAPGPGHGTVEQLLEQGAVGQPAERIVQAAVVESRDGRGGVDPGLGVEQVRAATSANTSGACTSASLGARGVPVQVECLRWPSARWPLDHWLKGDRMLRVRRSGHPNICSRAVLMFRLTVARRLADRLKLLPPGTRDSG